MRPVRPCPDSFVRKLKFKIVSSIDYRDSSVTSKLMMDDTVVRSVVRHFDISHDPDAFADMVDGEHAESFARALSKLIVKSDMGDL